MKSMRTCPKTTSGNHCATCNPCCLCNAEHDLPPVKSVVHEERPISNEERYAVARLVFPDRTMPLKIGYDWFRVWPKGERQLLDSIILAWRELHHKDALIDQLTQAGMSLGENIARLEDHLRRCREGK